MDDLDVMDASKQKGGKKGKKARRKKDEDDEDELEQMLADLQMEAEGKKAPPKPEEAKPVEVSTQDDVKGDDVKNNNKKNNKKKNQQQDKQPQQNNKPQAQQNNNKPPAKQQQQQNNKKPAEPKPEPKEEAQKEVEDVKSAAEESGADDDKGESSNKKKKDKKKKKKETEEEKKAKEDAKKKTKGPGAKALALMKEILAKEQAERERLEKEEEERIKKEEEAEEARLEKLRLEQEKKDKKKLKEKERKERLKKEGKLLTAKQKADIQRAKLSLQVAQEQGQLVLNQKVVPKVSERQRRKEAALAKQKSQEEQQASKEEETVSVHDSDDDKADDIVDDWEEMLDDDEPKKPATKAEPIPVPAKAVIVETPKFVANEPAANSSAAACSKPPDGFRSPIICVLGHVDTGKTKCLDYIRKTHVQDNEAGGITQQIGATFVPPIAIHEQCKFVSNKAELKMPGLLIIDTPGHESFTNLRSRGSSLCDIAILVVDIMHGLENQTIESINLLKSRKTPFVVALNKIDRLYGWKPNLRKDIEDLVGSQGKQTKEEFTKRTNEIIVQLAEQSINAALFYQNPDPRTYVSLVPTSAHSGDGMGNLINHVIQFSQQRLAKRITYVEDQLDCTVLEVKAIHGLGTTIDVILVNGRLKEGDKVVLAGHDGPIVTQIRSLLVPQPLKELRVKSPYEELKVVYGSMGIKIAAHDLEKAVAGLNMYVPSSDAEAERFKELCWSNFSDAMRAIKCKDKGVYVQASTLGSLEALLEFLKDSKIPYAGVRIGPVVKKDVMKASIMLENSPDHAVILAFDVKIERDAQELADHLGVKIFAAEIIYHLFDRFTEYKDKLKAERKEANRHSAVFPCVLRILPNCIFNKRDPIVLGVAVEEGILQTGTPIAVPGKELDNIGRVTTIEHDHKQLDVARKGQEVCIKIEHCGGDAPKLYGRHFDFNDPLYSKITRESIDIMKEHFRDDLEKSDWALIVKLKKIFDII